MRHGAIGTNDFRAISLALASMASSRRSSLSRALRIRRRMMVSRARLSLSSLGSSLPKSATIQHFLLWRGSDFLVSTRTRTTSSRFLLACSRCFSEPLMMSDRVGLLRMMS